MVRARHVVAEGGAGARADEERSRRAHVGGEAFDLLADELQVLGRELVRQPHRGACAAGFDERERLRGHARAVGGEGLRRAGDAVEKAAVVRDRDQKRVGAVLGLRKQVERGELGVGVRRRDHDELARARQAVDPDHPGHLPLRFGHPAVPRPDDHVD